MSRAAAGRGAGADRAQRRRHGRVPATMGGWRQDRAALTGAALTGVAMAPPATRTALTRTVLTPAATTSAATAGGDVVSAWPMSGTPKGADHAWN